MNNYQWLLQMDGADRKAWFDAEHVETPNGTLQSDTAALESKIDKWCETHIDYAESLGDASKALRIETFMTFDELVKLVRELRGDAE